MRFEVYNPSDIKPYGLLNPNGEILAEEDIPPLSNGSCYIYIKPCCFQESSMKEPYPIRDKEGC